MRTSRKTPANTTPQAIPPKPAKSSSNRSAAAAAIRIRGARQNNLQGLNLDIPVGKLTVVTGLSGAGKSSLVFYTLHAEGQRRYVETFSPYTRQFLDLLPAPKVDSIENIRPSIAIHQGNTIKTSRSTVGTMTELCDWFKVWFAHRAQLHDPGTGEVIRVHHPESVWEELAGGTSVQRSAFSVQGEPLRSCKDIRDSKDFNDLKVSQVSTSAAQAPATNTIPAAERSVLIGFEVVRPAKLKWSEVLAPFLAQGYAHGVLAGKALRLSEFPDKADAPTEAVLVQDRVTLAPENKERFLEAAGKAFRLGQGKMVIEDRFFHSTLVSRAGRQFRSAIPALFSFNSPIGACPACRGFGRVIGVDYGKVIPDHSRSLKDGAIAAFQGAVYSESQRDLERAAKKAHLPLNVPWRDLTDAQRDFVINGEPGYGTDDKKWPNAWYGVKEFFVWLESTAYKMHVRVFLSRYRSYSTCPECHGKRLREDALCWRWQKFSLPELYTQPVSALLALLRPPLEANSRHPADQALEAILARLGYLEDVGLGYLTLDRQSRTLSGGEVQRVNLTACLGANLADALFVLDEPSVGLHPRDLRRMTGILRRLVAQGNTVVVVEHDESVMRAADHLVEIGPRPGRPGGQLVYTGTPAGIHTAAGSATGPWLAGAKTPSLSRLRSVDASTPHLHLRDIHANNLRGLALDIPLGRFVGICGVSGSGKSTLLDQVLAKLAGGNGTVRHDDPEGGTSTRFTTASDQPIGEIALVDQSPVSRSPRSNAALYTGAWDAIRKLLADVPEAAESGLTASHFSFNSGDGRCPHCGGSGWETVEMQFLADVHVPCPVCDGRRFRPEILEFKYRGKSVADILELTVDDALEFFEEPLRKERSAFSVQRSGEPLRSSKDVKVSKVPPSASFAPAPDAAPAAERLERSGSPITRALSLLTEVGLGYLTLGQPLSTLSGGEAQRLKLARFLGNVSTKSDPAAPPPLILLDEPTTGLHREDVARLLGVLQRLVGTGCSLVIIEHHSDILRAADWLLELGPEAGDHGCRLIASGPPSAVACADTPTASYL